MKTILPKLDHSQKAMHKVFGLTDYERAIVKAAVIFERLSLHMIVQNLYNNIEEAPSNMQTDSGILEHALDLMPNANMQAYLLLTFKETYDEMNEMIDRAASAKEVTGGNPLEKTIKQFLNEMMAYPIHAAIETIKEVNHDFDEFIKRTIPEDKFNEFQQKNSGETDIEQLIREALKNKGLSDEDKSEE